MTAPLTDRIARAICREQCAVYGEPPCFELEDDHGKPVPWPNEQCDESGCQALAAAVVAELEKMGALFPVEKPND
jgi:hypothetical protein